MRNLKDIIEIKFRDYKYFDISINIDSSKSIDFSINSDIVYSNKIEDINIDYRYSDVEEIINLESEISKSYHSNLNINNFNRFEFCIYQISIIVLRKISKEKKRLYFLQNDEGLIKIGISNDVDYRIRCLENELKCKIIKIKDIDYSSYETKLHRMFNDYNAYYKGGREWFVPYPKLLKFIESVNDDNFIRLYSKLEKEKQNG